MALTRNYLKSLGLNEEQITGIIESHTETVNALKAERDTYKADAEKLADVQKQLDDLNKEDWKGKAETTQKAFDDYKRDMQNRETQGKVKTAYRGMLEELGIASEDIDLVMAGTDFSGMKLDGEGKLDGIDAHRETAKTKYARYIPDIKSQGDQPAKPPVGGSGKDAANPMAAKLASAFFASRYGA